ncbi:protein SOGA1 isoform X1 [Megalops cyprinoides]|uniref:protein SOGA1 isoform X1 n=1 Tax=Megalops cyprinoides TaxID=118141 RepID=UPI00186493A2|nr:protein SOGA1 isoform X1 [Megalops cyprinoides]
MTKTKVDVNSPTHFVSPKERRHRHKMESENGISDAGQAQPQEQHQFQQQPIVQPHQVNEKKKINRAPSPARPKDVPGWSLTKIRGGIGAPTLSVKPGAIHLGSRLSRRSPGSGKDTKSEKTKLSGKSLLSVAGSQKGSGKSAKSTRRKVSDASNASDDLSKDSGCAPGKLSPTDSSSELSDCASEENKLSTDALSSDTESSSRGGGADGERTSRDHGNGQSDRGGRGDQHAKNPVDKDRLSLGVDTGEGSISPGDERSLASFDSRMPVSTSLAFSDLTEEFMDGMHEEFVREIEELRSENDYLKDEMEELRSEMLEMRDMYMEEDVYQLQELRQQLDQANKTCRILQYRLRKAERRSLRVAQTGQVDGELIRTLEQDVKVAKDVSIRLHNELESIEKKRSRLEQENEDLRQKLQDLEVAKQVLQAEMDKARENSLKKRGARQTGKPDKKLSPQEDSSDLKCQLHFAKEESALMCKKLTKMAKDNESMREELAKYRSLYGEVDASLSVEEVADSPHTREAEVKVHLKLVEEEANLLSRRIVELEVENRGLRAEMDEMKCQELPGGAGHLVLAGGGAMSENVMEMQRHLQFVEEEADLLRRSLLEMEEQNKLLMNELNRYKSEQDPELDSAALSEDSCSVLSEASQEELLNARLQIGELSGKVKKLQYENRVLLSNLQRCDLASYHHSRLAMETDAEAGDSAECVPSQIRREGPVGGENDPQEEQEKRSTGGEGGGSGHAHAECTPQCLRLKDYEALLAVRDQAHLVTAAIQLLTAPDSNCPYRKISPPSSSSSNDAAEQGGVDKSPAPPADLPLMEALSSRLSALQTQLLSFVERVEILGSSGREQVEGASPLPLLSESGSFVASVPSVSQPHTPDQQAREITSDQKQPDFRDQSERQVKGQEAFPSKAEEGDNKDSNKDRETRGQEGKETDTAEQQDKIQELQALLSEARQKAQGAQEQLSQERQARRDDSQSSSQKLTQLQEEHQKALVRRDFQLQSLSLQSRLQQKFWSQERNLMVRESQQLKQSLLLLSLKLRWFLKQWRLGKKLDGEGKDILEVTSVKDLYLLLEEEGLASHQGDNKTSAAEEQSQSPTAKEHCLLEKNYKQTSGLSSTLADLKGALQDLTAELREERQGSHELTQQFARAKSSWEVERSELKSHITQLECKAGKASPGTGAGVAAEKETQDLKVALKREREEHQHLLADSYAAVMDLTKQLQISERSWSRERLELLERFNQERSQWEQRLLDAQSKSLHEKSPEKESPPGTDASRTHLQRTKSISSMSELDSLLDSCPFVPGQEGDRTNGKGTQSALLARTDLGDLNKKNWKYLTNEMALLEKGDPFKTWDCPIMSSSFPGLDLSREGAQRSYTAPDKTGIRIYYSPPAVRRMERRLAKEKQQQAEPGYQISGATYTGAGDLEDPNTSIYDRWLSKLSQQPRDLLENGSASSATSASLPPPFHGLEISGNLSDDMKEMTNCVRQAIRSSSLERKCKDTASQTVGVSSAATQTAQFVSIGLQTEGPRGPSLHTKSWSPRASSSLASARSRQISTSLEKVHSRIERPCCSPKYGSPKLQRRVSTSSSKLDSSKDRSLWNLHHRVQNGSAWARSTTTRDSPVLSGLNDGLSSLFSVVEHSGSVESLWKGEGCKAAGKPSGEPGAHKYGIVHEFFRNVCGRTQTPMPAGGGERPHRDSSSSVVDEVKPECPSSAALASNDNVTKIVNKRFMKQNLREEPGQTSKDLNARDSNALEDAACDCTSQTLTSCFSRPSRSATRHSLSQCRLRSQESTASTEEKGDPAHE